MAMLASRILSGLTMLSHGCHYQNHLRKNYWDNSKGERYTKIIEARNYGQIVMSIDNLIDDLNKTKQAIIEEVGVE